MTQSPFDTPHTPQQLDFWETDLHLPSSKPLYRIDEVATILSVSTNQVRNLTDSGELEAVPIGAAMDPPPLRHHVRITARSIEAFINRRRKEV